MSLELPYSYKPVNPVPVEFFFGPWSTLAAARAGVLPGIRYVGLTVGVQNGSNVDEYWFQGGVADLNLVPKGGGSGGAPFITNLVCTGVTDYTIVHGKGRTGVFVSIRDVDDNYQETVPIKIINANSIEIDLSAIDYSNLKTYEIAVF